MDSEKKLSTKEKQDFLNGNDVPENQVTNPWSIKIEPTEDFKDYEKEHPIEEVPILNKQLHDDGCSLKSEYDHRLQSLSSIIADVAAGNAAARDRPEFTNLNFPAIKTAIEWLIKTNQLSTTGKVDLMQNAWRLNFKAKPPTPQEFITEKYIGDQANSLYPWVKDIFAEYFDPLKPYRTLVLTQHIGAGKSAFSTLAQLYVSVHYALMWHPYKFFGLAPSSVFTQCMGGWNQKKASELLVEPFIQILECSPYFKRVRTHNDLTEASAEEVAECLHWTTSSPTAQPLDSKVYLPDGNYKLMKDVQVGDVIASPSTGSVEVTAIPFEDEANCYEIELEDGRTVRCSDKHLWKVRRSPDSEWEVRDLKYIMEHPEFEWEIIEIEDMKESIINRPC